MKANYRLLALAVLAAFTLTGCTWRQALATVGLAGVAAGGVAGYYYVKGDLEAERDKDIKAVHKAAQKGLVDKGYKIDSQTVDAVEGRIEASKGGDDKKVIVKTKKLGSGNTHISIRVGTFGDEALSKDILAAIDYYL
jgi:hypothetical protein